MLNILLAAGHGAGKAHNRGGLFYNEGDNNFDFSLVLKKELETYEGVTADLLRKKNTDNPTLEERAAAGAGYDLQLNLHSNGWEDPAVRGTEVFDSVERPNTALAKLISESVAETFAHRNRGAKYKEGQPGFNWYRELRFGQAKSAMIVECGFHTNPQDCRFFLDNHQKVAIAIARSVASHYGLRKKAVIETRPSWKEQIIIEGFEKGILTDVDQWLKRLDDDIPVWAAIRMILNSMK